MSHHATSSETDPLLSRGESRHVDSESDSDTTVPTSSPRFAPILRIHCMHLYHSQRGISMFARFDYYQDTFCPGIVTHCGWFENYVIFPGVTVRMEMWPAFALFVVSFTTVGWWSAFGDRRGRRPVLFVSLLGALLLDLIYLVVGNIPVAHYDAQDSLSLALIIYGVLGGFATYHGVIHAYTSDVSPSALSRTVIFAGLQALSFIAFRFGALIGALAGPVLNHSSLSYIFSVLITAGNLAYIHFALPESLPAPQSERQPGTPDTALKYIFSPFSVFLRSRKHLMLLALGVYTYSWTLGLDVAMLGFFGKPGYFPAVPVSITIYPIHLKCRLYQVVLPLIINLATLLGIVPALALLYKQMYGDSEKSALAFSKYLAQNSILLATLRARTGVLFNTFFFIYPFSVAALPALYSLIAAYLIALGRKAEIGALFGALAVWMGLAEYISNSIWSSRTDTIFGWAAAFLVITVLLLGPDGPPLPSEEDVALPDGGEGSV
ncbi:hypothetical protein C8R43DRAFT_1054140 [Mycena crocata]|nr:hypothetical protein C8R43DRAFT_1054140 [Mycena crocata]